MMRSTAPLSSDCLNLQLVEEILYDLPPLEGVFLHWHTHGVQATTAGIDVLFTRRKQLLGSTTLSGTSIRLPWACATECLCTCSLQQPYSPWESRPLHARLLRHGPRLRASETQQLLPPGVLVHQTVSLRMADTLLLCTSVGPHLLTRQQLRAIATALVLPSCALKHCTITPATDNPAERFALEPGMMSPFLPPSHDTEVTALVVLPWPKRWDTQEREVARALSLWESLLLPVRCLPHLLRLYARRAYPVIRVIELGSVDTAAEQVGTHIMQLHAAQLERASVAHRLDAGGTRPSAETGYHLTAVKRLLDERER